MNISLKDCSGLLLGIGFNGNLINMLWGFISLKNDQVSQALSRSSSASDNPTLSVFISRCKAFRCRCLLSEISLDRTRVFLREDSFRCGFLQ